MNDPDPFAQEDAGTVKKRLLRELGMLALMAGLGFLASLFIYGSPNFQVIGITILGFVIIRFVFWSIRAWKASLLR